MQLLNKKIKIAMIAHDGKKADMVSFVMKRLEFFKSVSVEVVATGTTGKHLIHAGLQKVQTMFSGPMGGDAQIGAEVAEKKIQAVFFFRDPLGMHPHEPDIAMLMRLCDVHDVPLATNPATAEATAWSLGGKIGPVTTAVARFASGADHTNVVTVSAQVLGLGLSTVQSTDKVGAVETKGRLYGVTAPINKTVSVKGSYGTKTGLAAGDVTAYNLGVNYAFSKRTSASLAYRSVDAGGTANDVKQVGLGLSHNF